MLGAPVIMVHYLFGSKMFSHMNLLTKNEKENFEHKQLISYELEEIEERALALTKIVVLVKWESNGIVHTEHFEFGCSYQQEDGNVGYPWKNNGAWILIPWKIQGLYK